MLLCLKCRNYALAYRWSVDDLGDIFSAVDNRLGTWVKLAIHYLLADQRIWSVLRARYTASAELKPHVLCLAKVEVAVIVSGTFEIRMSST